MEDPVLASPSSPPPAFEHYIFLENTVGLHRQGLLDFDKIGLRRIVSGKNTFPSEKYIPKPVVEELIDRLAGRQVVMTNEEHLISRHRILPLSLLQPLYKKGFRYFAFEALSADDSIINKRGYALIRETGLYSRDPIFGELIREAIALGYTLVPYDVKPGTINRSSDPAEETQNRETAQADNIIASILRKDPSAKILLHGGRGHIAKGSHGYDFKGDGKPTDIRFMAEMFKQKTGIDPYTINQLKLEERSDTIFEQFPNRWMRTKVGYKNMTLALVSKDNGNVYDENSDTYDCLALSTETTYTNDRPDWLVNLPGKKLYDVDVKDFQPAKGYYMVQAIYATEDTLYAVPADQYAYQKGKIRVSLVLKKGAKYLIRVLNFEGEILKEWFKKM